MLKICADVNRFRVSKSSDSHVPYFKLCDLLGFVFRPRFANILEIVTQLFFSQIWKHVVLFLSLWKAFN